MYKGYKKLRTWFRFEIMFSHELRSHLLYTCRKSGIIYHIWIPRIALKYLPEVIKPILIELPVKCGCPAYFLSTKGLADNEYLIPRAHCAAFKCKGIVGNRYGPLARYVKLWVAHAPGMPGMLPCHRRQRKPLVSDPGMHHGTCITHVGIAYPRRWGNIPGIPGACAIRNFTYRERGPCRDK